MFGQTNNHDRVLRNISDFLAALDLTVSQAGNPENERVGFNVKDRAMFQVEAALREVGKLERLRAEGLLQSEKADRLAGLKQDILDRAEKVGIRLH